MNRKTLECLVHAGCFDWTGSTRAALAADIERAVDYAARKEEAGRYGQASLFEGSGEVEFPPFEPGSAPEYPRQELLALEKQLLGFYVSGHPMDEFRQVWERSADAPVAHPERANPDRVYTLVAMLKEFREILTKSGRKMAFGAVEDFAGSIEIVVFADALEKWRERFVVDKVLCLRGRIDLSRNAPSFKVEDFADPAELRERSWREVHLRLAPGISREEELYDLRDAVFEVPGPCQVFFHVPLDAAARAPGEGPAAVDPDCLDREEPAASAEPACGDGAAEPASAPAAAKPAPPRGPEAVVKAHVQMTCSASPDALALLKAAPGVAEVWRD